VLTVVRAGRPGERPLGARLSLDGGRRWGPPVTVLAGGTAPLTPAGAAGLAGEAELCVSGGSQVARVAGELLLDVEGTPAGENSPQYSP
jgi:hypothetical protein